MGKQPLYPYVPMKKKVQFPHITGAGKTPTGILEAGTMVRLKEPKEKAKRELREKPFIKVGERVCYIGSSRYRYADWPEGAWMEKGMDGTVTEYYPKQPEVVAGGEKFEAIEAWAVVRWDNGGSTAIDHEDEGKQWERIKASPPAG